MKSPILPLIAGAALVAAALSFWSPQASAQSIEPGVVAPAVYHPYGRPCVVTVDPQSRLSDSENPTRVLPSKSGLVAADSVEGVLVRMDPEWIVLKDGNYENWIPRDKVLMIRVSR